MALTSFTLVHPHSQYELSYREALAEYQSEGRDPVHTDLIDTQGFAAYITALRAMEDPAQVPQEFVPSTTWWLVGGEAYHGRLSMRHELNANLLQFGGHIGYDIRPTSRGQRLGTLQLRLGLEKAREIGLRRVLLTCDHDNARSARLIEGNGGILENEIPLPGNEGLTRRYWIEI